MPEVGIMVPNMGTARSAGPSKLRALARRPANTVRTGLADALFSRTQQKVLALLFGQPDRAYFTNELIGLAGAGSGAVQREVQRLVESKLVTVTRVGNQKHYQADPAAPIFEALRDIVVKTLGPAQELRAALAVLGDKVRLALVYGSIAKHSDTAHSDIDLLIVSDVLMLEQTFAVLAQVELRLGRHVSPTLYTVAEFRLRRKGGSPFLTKVLAGQYSVVADDKDDLLGAG
jgi:predicted nucleotidyltransferase